MSFSVEPQALRTYARQLEDARQVADAAKRYVHQYGDLSLHERGLISLMAPWHQQLVAALNDLLGHLETVTDSSADALRKAATHYERTDLRTEGAIDATYPAVPRPSGRD
jgi:hypothetical protein